MHEIRLGSDELRAHWHLDVALAYVRGSLPDLAEDDPQRLLTLPRERGLDLDPFKRSRRLPRIQAVQAMLRSFGPATLVDLGTGRGRHLWPLLETLPTLDVTTVDQDARHVARIEAVRLGGIERLRGLLANVEAVPLPDRSADGVTALEVLEHAADPARVACEAVRLARRFLIMSVPSRPDDNPEHVRLFDAATLASLLSAAGARRVTVQQVPGHYVALADTRSA